MSALRREGLDAALHHPLPTRLFHYTSSSGLLGIVSSRTIWATEASFLNDSEEIRHARQYAEILCYNLLNNNHRDRYDKTQKVFIERLMDTSKQDIPGIFIASFSEQRDQLSQWRAYAGDQDGFSLGFPAVKLKEAAENAGFFLAKCAYDNVRSHNIVEDLFNTLFKEFMESDRSEEDIIRIAKKFPKMITMFGPLIKHRSFAEEQEWRIFSQQIDLGDARVRYRVAAGKLVPYVDFAFDQNIINEGSLDKMVVDIGPTNNYENNYLAVSGIIRKHLGSGVGFGRSEAPYRATK